MSQPTRQIFFNFINGTKIVLLLYIKNYVARMMNTCIAAFC